MVSSTGGDVVLVDVSFVVVSLYRVVVSASLDVVCDSLVNSGTVVTERNVYAKKPG